MDVPQSNSNRSQETPEDEGADATIILRTAQHVALDILSSRTGVEAVRHIALAARALTNAKYAAIGVINADGTGLDEFVTVGLSPEQEAAIGTRPEGKGLLGQLIGRSSPLHVDEISSHPASVGFPSGHPPMNSFLGVPIRRGINLIGNMYLCNKTNGQPFSSADATAVEQLGAYAAVAIYNLQMLKRQRALVNTLMTVQEDERRAIAYDLHDGLTQLVLASFAHVETGRDLLTARKLEDSVDELNRGIDYLNRAVLESRRVINGLRSLILDDLGAIDAIGILVEEERERSGWRTAEYRPMLGGFRFPQPLETAVYRVAQEALTNIRKHAQAANVRVMIGLMEAGARSESFLVLTVEDDGCGFTPERFAGTYDHLGLHGMRERAELMGGKIEISSSIGNGTRIEARFPSSSGEAAFEKENSSE